MSYSVAELLNFLKLDEYLPNFLNNDVADLRTIDESLLISIGIDKVGHRKRILSELANLLGVGNYYRKNELKTDNFDGGMYVTIDPAFNRTAADDIAPPLPPKLKDLNHNGNSGEIASQIKSRPVKPPRITAPYLQKTMSPGALDSSVLSNKSVAEISSQSLNIQTTASNKTQLENELSIQASLSDRSYDPTIQTFPPLLTPTSSSHSSSYSLSESISIQTSFNMQAVPTTPGSSESIPLYGAQILPQPVIPTMQHSERTTEPPVETVTLPAIPPQDYSTDRLVRATISKEERLSKTQSADLMSFNEIIPGPSVNDFPGDLARSTSLKKSNTIAGTKKLEVALWKSRHNKGVKSDKCRGRIGSYDPQNIQENTNLSGNTSVTGHDNVVAQEVCGSCSDDDLSEDEDVEGLDGIPISMTRDKDKLYSIVGDKTNVDLKAINVHRKSRFFQPKSGNLNMQYGKRIVRRWVEFTGSEIKGYKEKNGILKLTLPVLSMTDVIWEKDVKKPTFHITTKNKKYTFIEPNGDHDAMTIWAKVIFEGLLDRGEEVDGNLQNDRFMSNPDFEGYLSKEGHNIIHDIRRRYVVIKETKLCYYNTKEEFEEDQDFLSCLEMALVSLKCEEERLRLILNTHTNKNYVFQAEDMTSFNCWKEAIESSIQMSHADYTIINQIQENKSNMKCADCDDNNPIWASINLLVATCPKCIGVHRLMGVHVSKPRSLLMDERVWTSSSVKLLLTVGNEKANCLWAHNLPADDMIHPLCSKEEREEFIKAKYKEKKYFDWSPLYGQPVELGTKLREVVVTDDLLETLKLLISGVDIYYVAEDSYDQRTPYELAKEAGMELQMELLYQFNGHLTKDERKALEQKKSAMQQTKSGILQIKTTRNDTLKERQCTLLDKKIELKKVEKVDDCEVIDLTKLEELEIDKEDRVTLILRLSDRTYFLKSYIPEETESWFHAIRSKQTFGVPIEVQECNKKNIPYLIGECISYMEQHALLTQGIYRLSGSQITIKRLTLLFNQDAASIKLLIDDYHDVHAVAGLIKLYLRQLPEPIFTKKLYEDWIRNAEVTSNDEDHNKKLYRYKSLLEELPPCNYNVIRFLILHLNQVINLSEINKMALNNITVIFGPIMLSCGNTVDQAWLKREYSVVSDILTYYQWLFDVTEVEVKVLKGMIDFLRSTQQSQYQQSPVAGFTMVTIFIGDNEDQMQMTSNTKPSDVCLFCLQKHNLSINSNWGLFEVTVEGELERLIHASEAVLKLAENMGVKRRLVIKCNYVTDIIAAHMSSSLCISGYLHYNKGSSWRKNCYVELKTGNLRVYKAKGNTKEEENLAIHEIQLFIGNAQKKKPLTRFGFALFKPKEDEFRYFCAEDEIELNKFIANILQVKYPSGVWTPISSPKDEAEITSNAEDSSLFWGRQSTIIRPNGTANKLLAQLEKRRTTLKNIFMK